MINQLNPIQQYIEDQKAIDRGATALAKQWRCSKPVYYQIKRTGKIRGTDLLRRISETSNIDPRVLLGMPDIAICLLCRGKMHVNRLSFEFEELEEKESSETVR